ncbi:sensor histidine kinase [Kribbella sp. NPDC049227]|uniref:sensor histidine kinase n=1 Tax=Kribbella sp. NPDC049227 TaxID=3364113 RepID=UPI00371A9DCA
MSGVGGGTVAVLADSTVGVILLGCGLIARRSRTGGRVGLIMIAAAGCWFLGTFVAPFLFLHRGPLVHLHISYPTGRLRRPIAWITVMIAYAVSLLEAVVRTPWLTLGLAVLVAAAAVDVFARTSGRARKAGWPALIAALTFAAVLAFSCANLLLGWEADRLVLFVYDTTIAVLALVLTADLRSGRWTDATLSDLVTQLGGGGPGTGGLRGELQQALGDPTLVVGYWVPDQAQYVDERGVPLALPDAEDGRSTTTVTDGGEPIAVLVDDNAVLDDHKLVAGVSAALNLAVANARMRAEVQARVSALAASRRRIVEAADAQRRALEAELALGAERRLGQVARLVADVQRGSSADGLADVVAEVRGAQMELREFAQGVRPSPLGSGGLSAALPVLAARAPLQVELAVSVGRLPPAVEAALFFVCSEALTNIAKHANATRVQVTVEPCPVGVVTTVIDDGVGGADPRGSGLRGLADRVEALNGHFAVGDGPGGGTLVLARIPVGDGPDGRGLG